MYNNILKMGCKLLDALGFPEDPEDPEAPAVSDKEAAEHATNLTKEMAISMPTHDAVESVITSGMVMNYQAFHDVFCGPIHLELESTNLWPVSPPLAY